MASVDVSGGSGGGGGGFVTGAYLSAYDIGNYPLGAPFAVQELQFGTVTLSNNVTIQGPNSTDIIFSGAGIYLIDFSVQVTCSTPQAHLFYLWLCKNGAPVANTNSVLTIHGTHGGNNGHMIASWSFMVNALPSDAFQICWTADNTAISVATIPSPGGTIPVSPAVILSVSQV